MTTKKPETLLIRATYAGKYGKLIKINIGCCDGGGAFALPKKCYDKLRAAQEIKEREMWQRFKAAAIEDDAKIRAEGMAQGKKGFAQKIKEMYENGEKMDLILAVILMEAQKQEKEAKGRDEQKRASFPRPAKSEKKEAQKQEGTKK